MTDKILCPQCLEDKEVISKFGKFAKLSCNHLIAVKDEASIVKQVEAETIKAIETSSFNDPFFDEFMNKKTGDRPYPFQVEGIEFISSSGFRCLIADEMGLGKTIQALGGLKKFREKFFPCLIIVKSKLKTQWMVQLLNWCGIEFIPQIIMDGKLEPVDGFDIYIVSYDIIRRFTTETDELAVSEWGHKYKKKAWSNPFYSFGFKGIIMDEVQSIKGNSQRAHEVKRIIEHNQPESIVGLSGTPIKNNADEYFTILNILKPAEFPDQDRFREDWLQVDSSRGYPKYGGIKSWRLAEWERKIKPFVIRRTREDVREQIGLRVTTANRIFHHVDFESDKFKRMYEAEEAKFIREMESSVKQKSPTEILGQLAVMRHLVGLNKIQPSVDYAINFLLETDRPLLILAHHQDVQESIYALLSQWCVDGGYDIPVWYKAGLTDAESFQLIDKILVSPNCKFMVATTLGIGEGVDRLQLKFRDLMIVERQWNPANEEQAEARLVRIGQKHDFVDAIYPIVSDTIDEDLTTIVETKRRDMKKTLDFKVVEWNESSLLVELYEVMKNKKAKRDALKKGKK